MITKSRVGGHVATICPLLTILAPFGAYGSPGRPCLVDYFLESRVARTVVEGFIDLS